MYSTCLFCKTNLGANEAVEHFPIGRRLAFDGAKGRLWVVCRKCERWNLTPIEERWEAIEECERFYRATKLRVSTDEIGLARISEGLELVRIGKPLRPEFAAWRYGDQFGSRRRKRIIQMGAAIVGGAAIPLLGPALGLSLGASGIYYVQIATHGQSLYYRFKILERLATPDGTPLLVRRNEIRNVAMLAPTAREPWGLRISHYKPRDPDVPWWRYDQDAETSDIRGEHAMRAAAQILPRLNRKGASARVVTEAVTLATANSDPTASFEEVARYAAKRRTWNDYGKGAMLSLIPDEIRLSLEMISHEDSERRALEGELYLLEEAWKDAEEIAGISDNMFLPSAISDKLGEMKRQVD
ncbi:MAG TPA: hypothetical protein VD771_02305 [Gemmatimonadaceae bacterium]|nr:hypothetical protein [Gemmatimonadaceae bacterium]